MAPALAAPSAQDHATPSTSASVSGASRYQKVRDLNRGAHGVVQLCVDRVTGEQVAIKFLERGDKITQYVEREIMNHRSLNHPHVIQFKEVFLTSQHLAIVMEFAPGGDLFDYIMSRGKRLSEALARWFYQQLIIALDYCHKMGVANRDIKLENTLLTNQSPPLIRLCDFGYSKNAELHSAPRSLVGTPAYLAPEVIKSVRGSEYNGQAADVWSSGVMLYVMLVGGYPFERVTDQEPQKIRLMYERIQRVDYIIPTSLNLSRECQDLLRRILVADPAQRITIQQITQHPWFTKGLPAEALRMNDVLPGIPEGAQSAETIRSILEEARRPPGAPPAPPAPSGNPAGGPAGTGGEQLAGLGRDYLDDWVDEALMHPQDSDAAMQGGAHVVY